MFSDSLSVEIEGFGKTSIFPEERRMESDRHAHESNGPHDDFAAFAHYCFAQDDERSGDKTGNGANATKHERSESGIESYGANLALHE